MDCGIHISALLSPSPVPDLSLASPHLNDNGPPNPIANTIPSDDQNLNNDYGKLRRPEIMLNTQEHHIEQLPNDKP
jgi:hypothetical protein